MKKILLFLPLLMLSTAPGVLCAAEYRGDVCRFVLPDGFELRDVDDGSLFTAVRGDDNLAFYHLRTEEKINKSLCLRIPDAQWFAVLQPYQVVETGKSWFARYDKYTIYRKPDGAFVKVYRYVTTRQIGFLVAKNVSGDWSVADEAAAGCRGFRSLWERIERSWHWLIGAILVIGLVLAMREKFASRIFWRRAALWTLAAGAIYAAVYYFFPQYMTVSYIAIALGYGFILFADSDDSSGSDGDDGSSSGYDGTGKTFNVDI